MKERIIAKGVKQMINDLLDRVLQLTDRYGVKSVVSVASILSLWKLAEAGAIPGLYGGIGITIVAVGFFVARHLEHKQEVEKK